MARIRVPFSIACVAVVLAACGGVGGANTSKAARTLAPTSSPVATDVPAGPCRYVGPDPDPSCTPGAAATAVTAQDLSGTICRSGYTATVRPPLAYTDALKRQLLRSYGDTAPAAAYELDHLVPLELGGDPRSPRNLWPEPWERSSAHPQGFALHGGGAQTKDKVENELRRRACLPTSNPEHMDLAAAQAAIAKDWHAEAQQLHLAS